MSPMSFISKEAECMLFENFDYKSSKEKYELQKGEVFSAL